jgi:hypothetical protein
MPDYAIVNLLGVISDTPWPDAPSPDARQVVSLRPLVADDGCVIGAVRTLF